MWKAKLLSTVFHRSLPCVSKQRQGYGMTSAGGILAHQGLYNQTIYKKKKKKRDKLLV